MSPKHGLDESPKSMYQDQPVYKSNSIHDRSSTFVAIFSSSAALVSSPKQLQKNPEFSDATHRVLAWRRRSNQSALSFGRTRSSANTQPVHEKIVFETGSDEDGETYAGRKLEALLEKEGVEGVVVVARWYGGIMLGPVRFKWIEDVAKEAIEHSRMQGNGPKEAKKVRFGEGNGEITGGSNPENSEAERKEKERLLQMMKDRDGTIAILRSLLKEKNEKLEGAGKEEIVDAQTGQASDDGKGQEEEASLEAKPSEEQKDARNQNLNEDFPEELVALEGGEGPANGQTTSKISTEQVIRELAPIARAYPGSSLSLPPSPDYEAMPLDRLKQIEKARDATIAWILKQIDVAEERLRTREEAHYRRMKVKAETIRREEMREEAAELRELQKKRDEYAKQKGEN